MNFIVCGDFDDRKVFEKAMAKIDFPDDTAFISLHNGRTDMLAESYGKFRNFKVYVFHKHDEYEERADTIRELEALYNADALIAFWEGKDKRTGHLIETMKNLRRQVLVFDYYGNVLGFYKGGS